MVCDHKSLTVINNSFVFSSKIIRECFTGAENDSLYQSTVPLPETKRPAPKGAGLLLCGMDHLNTVQVFVMVMMPTMIALMMPAM